VPRGPALLGDGHVGGRRGDRRETGLEEGLAGGQRLTGEARTDQAPDRVVVDDLRRKARSGVRAALGVELLQADLAVGVLVVVLLQRQVDAVDHVLAEGTGVAGQRAEEREVLAAQVAAGAALAPAVAVVVVRRAAGRGQCQRGDARERGEPAHVLRGTDHLSSVIGVDVRSTLGAITCVVPGR
jgi:hypothetical protein